MGRPLQHGLQGQGSGAHLLPTLVGHGGLTRWGRAGHAAGGRQAHDRHPRRLRGWPGARIAERSGAGGGHGGGGARPRGCRGGTRRQRGRPNSGEVDRDVHRDRGHRRRCHSR